MGISKELDDYMNAHSSKVRAIAAPMFDEFKRMMVRLKGVLHEETPGLSHVEHGMVWATVAETISDIMSDEYKNAIRGFKTEPNQETFLPSREQAAVASLAMATMLTDLYTEFLGSGMLLDLKVPIKPEDSEGYHGGA